MFYFSEVKKGRGSNAPVLIYSLTELIKNSRGLILFFFNEVNIVKKTDNNSSTLNIYKNDFNVIINRKIN